MNKKHMTLILMFCLLLCLYACGRQENIVPTDMQKESTANTDEMPKPFYDIQGIGGDVETAPFYLITENGEGVLSLNDISYDTFVSEDDFFAWINEEQAKDYFHTPQTSISDYPNIYSFIKAFNVPIEKVKEFYDERLRLNYRTGAHCLPEEGIDALCSLDEAKILEYFVSDYAIYTGGDKAYSPAWVYYHTPEDYEEAGIMPEMLEAKREMYNKLPLTEEALTAFNDKIDEAVNFAQSR